MSYKFVKRPRKQECSVKDNPEYLSTLNISNYLKELDKYITGLEEYIIALENDVNKLNRVISHITGEPISHIKVMKLSKFEKNKLEWSNHYVRFCDDEILMGLKKAGSFKNVYDDSLFIEDILNNCEVEEGDSINE